MLDKLKNVLRKLTKKQKTMIAVSLAVVLLAFVVLAAEAPLALSVANTRQLPIYSVERDQKMVSLSFDAAWGDVILRRIGRNDNDIFFL